MTKLQLLAGAALAGALASPLYSQAVLQQRRCGEVQATLRLEQLTVIRTNPADPWEYFTAAQQLAGGYLDEGISQAAGANRVVRISGQDRIYSSSIASPQTLELKLAGEQRTVRFIPVRRQFSLCAADSQFKLPETHLFSWRLEYSPRVHIDTSTQYAAVEQQPHSVPDVEKAPKPLHLLPQPATHRDTEARVYVTARPQQRRCRDLVTERNPRTGALVTRYRCDREEVLQSYRRQGEQQRPATSRYIIRFRRP